MSIETDKEQFLRTVKLAENACKLLRNLISDLLDF